MKRHIIIGLSTLAILLTGCAKEVLSTPESNTACSTGQKATFEFVPRFCGDGPDTKGLASNPSIHNIFFAVFDAAGYKLAEYAEAVPNSYATTNSPDRYSYSVELTVTDQPRIIHIIANAPEHLIYGSESEVIGSLFTYYDASDNDYDWKDAYWDRIFLENGVWTQPDPATENTDPEYDAKYAKFKQVVDKLSEAALIRNFTRVKVVDKADNFEMTGFWLTNIPDRGSVAPYNRNTGFFQIDYSNYNNIQDMLGNGVNQGNYQGFYPATASLIGIDSFSPEQLNAAKITGAEDWTGFCFEREIPRELPLYVIVEGRYNGGPSSYYKIDFRDENGDYFPVLRNFTYRVSINSVSRAGASSVQGALDSAPSGEVSTSLEMQDLTNISNGEAQIFVSETEAVIVDETDVVLRYKYIPNLKGDNNATAGTPYNDIWDGNGVKPDNYVTIETESESTGDVFDWSTFTPDDTDSKDDFREIHITSHPSSAVVKTQTITITGYHKENDGTYSSISRKVVYRLHEKLQMTLRCDPTKVPNKMNEAIDLYIGIEAGLPSSIFSLDMEIESRGLYLTSNTSSSDAPLPISTGASTIPAVSRPTFVFTRTITWSEYVGAPVVDGYKYFPCKFKTNSAGFSSDDIYVSNHYFVQNHTTYTTYSPRKFSNLAYGGANRQVGKEMSFSFDMDAFSGSEYTVTVGMNGFEPSSSETRLTPAGVNSEGYELYTLTVTRNTGNSISITPYNAGTGKIKLYADEYIPSDVATTTIIASDIRIYADVNRNNNSAIDWIQLTGADVTGANTFVKGQTGTLTIYIANDDIESGSTVKIGSDNATKMTSGTNRTINIDGINYTAWQVTNFTAPSNGSGSGGAQNLGISISIDGIIVDRLNVPVYGMTRSNTSLGSGAPTVGTWYIMRNRDRNTYLTYSNSSLALDSTDNNYSSLLRFTSNTTSTKVFWARANNYVVGTNGAFSFDGTGTTYTRGSSGQYMRLSYVVSGIFRNTTYYWRDAAMSTSTGNNRSDWSVFPVTIYAPPTL